MFKDIKLYDKNGFGDIFGETIIRIEEGIYEGTFNLDNRMSYDLSFEEVYPNLGIKLAYGVGDSIEQIKEYYKEEIEDKNKAYVLSTYILKKANEPKERGWRRHKRGYYIGTKEPKCEYLYDEGDDINEVVVFSIYDITKHLNPKQNENKTTKEVK